MHGRIPSCEEVEWIGLLQPEFSLSCWGDSDGAYVHGLNSGNSVKQLSSCRLPKRHIGTSLHYAALIHLSVDINV